LHFGGVRHPGFDGGAVLAGVKGRGPSGGYSNPRSVGLELEDQIVRLRKTLTKRGLDAGAETTPPPTYRPLESLPAVCTISRIRVGRINRFVAEGERAFA
jgi:hypothetical protein